MVLLELVDFSVGCKWFFFVLWGYSYLLLRSVLHAIRSLGGLVWFGFSVDSVWRGVVKFLFNTVF